MSGSMADSDLPGWVAGILLLAGTVSVSGLADYTLTNAGYGEVAIFIWALCYAVALATVWIVWLRDIELTGPADG